MQLFIPGWAFCACNQFKLDFFLHEHCKGTTTMSGNLINMQRQVFYVL